MRNKYGEKEKDEDQASCKERQKMSRGYLFFILRSDSGEMTYKSL